MTSVSTTMFQPITFCAGLTVFPTSSAASFVHQNSVPSAQMHRGIITASKSQFVRSAKPWQWSIKLEGSRRVGARKVSHLHIDLTDLAKVPADILVYGRNGVQSRPVSSGERELGIIVATTSMTEEGAVLLASLLTHYLIH
jgi:hypothetical protein